jgi:cell division protein FtsL
MGTAKKRPAGRIEKKGRVVRNSSGNRKVQPYRKTIMTIWILVMMLFFVEALLYAWCRVQCTNVGYAIDTETLRHQELIKARNTMKIELARLKSPQRIETIARTRLGLTMPTSQQTVTLR